MSEYVVCCLKIDVNGELTYYNDRASDPLNKWINDRNEWARNNGGVRHVLISAMPIVEEEVRVEESTTPLQAVTRVTEYRQGPTIFQREIETLNEHGDIVERRIESPETTSKVTVERGVIGKPGF